MSRKIIASNWKMNKNRQEALEYMEVLEAERPKTNDLEVMIFTPHLFLLELNEKHSNEQIKIGSQDVHSADKGAHTGGISPAVLADEKLPVVLIGHSERRGEFNESDEVIHDKVLAALRHNLEVVLCVGEPLEVRQNDKVYSFLKGQLESALKGISLEDLNQIVIAYEPIWAIGTGETADAETANETAKIIQDILKEIYADEKVLQVPILYGGSVKEDNIVGFMKEEAISGVLVGGASLDAAHFARMISIVAEDE